jgi:rare lipoprotein A
VQSGVASWYGCEQQGVLTANGETFNRHKFTAASRHLNFNSVVRVTNEKNGRSVNVRINDRGPYAKGRVLDLSEAAAKSLDMKASGTAPVKIEMVQPASAQTPISP